MAGISLDEAAAAVAVVGARVEGTHCRRHDLSAGKENLWTSV
jgi:hypothetical protein